MSNQLPTHVKESGGKYSFSKPVTREEIIQIALSLQLQSLKKMPCLSCPRESRQFLQLHLSKREQEVFTVLFLNANNTLISCVDMFFGTVSESAVYPREIVKEALKQNAVSVIVSHNHPSGFAQPSHADIAITDKIHTALKTVDIKLIDHIIVGAEETVSLAQKGLIG